MRGMTINRVFRKYLPMALCFGLSVYPLQARADTSTSQDFGNEYCIRLQTHILDDKESPVEFMASAVFDSCRLKFEKMVARHTESLTGEDVVRLRQSMEKEQMERIVAQITKNRISEETPSAIINQAIQDSPIGQSSDDELKRRVQAATAHAEESVHHMEAYTRQRDKIREEKALLLQEEQQIMGKEWTLESDNPYIKNQSDSQDR
jgi:hypothetical protein